MGSYEIAFEDRPELREIPASAIEMYEIHQDMQKVGRIESVRTPVGVYESGDGYHLLDGHHRLLSVLLRDVRATIPAVVVSQRDAERLMYDDDVSRKEISDAALMALGFKP